MYRGMRNKILQLATVSFYNRTSILVIEIVVGLPISSIWVFSCQRLVLRSSTNLPGTLPTYTDGDYSARFHSMWQLSNRGQRQLLQL